MGEAHPTEDDEVAAGDVRRQAGEEEAAAGERPEEGDSMTGTRGEVGGRRLSMWR